MAELSLWGLERRWRKMEEMEEDGGGWRGMEEDGGGWRRME